MLRCGSMSSARQWRSRGFTSRWWTVLRRDAPNLPCANIRSNRRAYHDVSQSSRRASRHDRDQRGTCGTAMAEPAADADTAQGDAERLRARQRHQGLVRNFRPRRAGHPAAWRPRQRQLLGPPGPRAATALSGHRHGQPRARAQQPQPGALWLRSDGLGRGRPAGSPEDQEGGGRRLERRRDHRPRHRDEASGTA